MNARVLSVLSVFLLLCAPVHSENLGNKALEEELIIQELLRHQDSASSDSTGRSILTVRAIKDGISDIMRSLLSRDSKPGARVVNSETWFSSNPEDLQPLTNSRWSFIYMIISTFAETITFGTDIVTLEDGTVSLPCFDEYDDLGGAFFTEIPASMGGGHGFAMMFFGEILEKFYFFKVDSGIATGYYQSRSIATGSLYDARQLIGIKIDSKISFTPAISAAPSPDSDNDSVIDEWDNCPSTPANSYVDKYGCPVTVGDINGDGKVSLEEAIHALQLVSGLKPK